MNAHPKKSAAKQTRFLAAYRDCGTVTGAARASGVDHSSHYRWLRRSPAYADAFTKSQQIAADTLEAEARRRAVDGVHRVRFGRDGKPLIDPVTGEPYCEVRYSDALLIFLLKANNAAKFGDRRETTHRRAPASPVAIYQLPQNGRDALTSDRLEVSTPTTG